MDEVRAIVSVHEESVRIRPLNSNDTIPSCPALVSLETRTILDAATGLIVAVISSLEDELAAYEIIVERERVGWRVISTRLSINK